MLTSDDSWYPAMQLFYVKGIEEIPVVEDQENKWVVGILKRRDVIAEYNHLVLMELPKKRRLSESPVAGRN